MKSFLLSIHSILIFVNCFSQNNSHTSELLKLSKKLSKLGGYVVINDTLKTEITLMAEGEIANINYREFVIDYKNKYGNDSAKFYLPDTTLWKKAYLGETLMNTYFSHPVYDLLPVVCISHEQAKGFCRWLENLLNKKYGNKTVRITVSLPTLKEWLTAASGNYHNSKYPFTDNLLDSVGYPLANYNPKTTNLKESDEYYRRKDGFINTKYTYPAGYYGLRNMAGNVSEFVLEKGILKGGSWLDSEEFLQNTNQQLYTTNGAAINNGFRVIVKVFTLNSLIQGL